MLHYQDCLFSYTPSVIRAIEESYQCGYLMLGRRGIEYEVCDPLRFAEYRCDYEMGLKHIGRKVGKGRMSYKEVCLICDYLNGVKQ